ncbi:ABC transporter ATP-binding protein [Micromonospora sp. NPDC050397]|uniref:ABC transporter ATP-binding protein n=1 Tax=Micromonospora sp. NPDC050397 TaxID=3364279 RepID=UPI00384BE8D4
MDNAIEVRELRRRYGGPTGFEAVRGVSFSVRRGELFALLGTNGAGKTSTLELIEGLERPTGGDVRVLGRDPYRERGEVRPRIGVMLQEGGFPSDLTVAETARMWAGLLTRAEPVGRILELVGLAERSRVPVKQLSGGERRRLDLALALLNRPEVLFLDEPTTGLDPESRRNTWRLVRRLLADGTTVLLTTHYLEEAEALADRLAIMHRGQLVTVGTRDEVVAAYPARIRFTLPDGVDPAEVPALPGARAVGAGPGVADPGPDRASDPWSDAGDRRSTVLTDDLQGALAALLAWAKSRDIRFSHLDARSASLEEAFLAVAESGTAVAETTGPDLERVA